MVAQHISSTSTWGRKGVCNVLFSYVAYYRNLIFNSGNVLLDKHFTAKLGDFGFTRELPLSTKQSTLRPRYPSDFGMYN